MSNEAVSKLTSLLAGRPSVPAGALFTYAFVPSKRYESMSQLVTGRLIFSDAERPARLSMDYGRVQLRELWLPDSVARATALALLSGSPVAIGDVPGTSVQSVQYTDSVHEFDQRWGNLSGWREDRFLIRVAPQDYDLHSSRPLARSGLPPHPSEAHAVLDWVWPERIQSYSGGMIQGADEIAILLPDSRARIADAKWSTGTGLQYLAESRVPTEELEVQMWIQLYDGKIRSGVASNVAALGVDPRDVARVEVYLLHDGTLLSMARLAPRDRVLIECVDELPPGKAAKLALASGESERVEFKPFLRDHPEKLREVIKVVIALCNTEGGRILVGVTDEALLQGQDALLRDAFSGRSEPRPPASVPLAHAKRIMQSRLLKAINDDVKPTPRIRYRWVKLSGAPVLMLEVDGSSPYLHSTKDHDVWIRKGSTNRRPDPETELRPLYERRRGGPLTELRAELSAAPARKRQATRLPVRTARARARK